MALELDGTRREGVRPAVVAVVLAFAVSAQQTPAPSAPRDRSASAGATLDSLDLVGLEANASRLVVLSAADGKVRSSYELGSRERFSHGPNLVYEARTSRVLFNVVKADRERGSISTRTLALDLRTSALKQVAEVLDSIGYPWLDVGSRSGLLYFVASEGLRVAILDPNLNRVERRLDFSRDRWHTWTVYRARLSSDESRLYVSYHGGCSPPPPGYSWSCSTGIDWIGLSDPPGRCVAQSPAGFGCLSTHGDFALLGPNILAASRDGLALIASSSGKESRWIGSRSPGHVMNFAIDSASGRVYWVADCLYGAGVSVASLQDSTSVASFGRDSTTATCGSFPTLSADGRVLVAVNSRVGLDVFDALSGALLSRLPSPRLSDLVVVQRRVY